MHNHTAWETEFILCAYANKLLSKLERISIKKSVNLDVLLIKKSISFAKHYHHGQVRQTGEPYYSHPLEVAGMVCDYLFDTNALITSILHDTLEDTALTWLTISDHFGEVIANQVEDLTRVKPQGKITSAEILKRLWEEKKHTAILIKLFDRLHNMQTIFAKTPEKQQKIVTETLQYFLALSEILEVPQLAKTLYNACYETNVKLGVVNEIELILDKPVVFVDSLISENN